MTTNNSGMVGGAYEKCTAMQGDVGDRYESNLGYVMLREGVVELASRDADATLLASFEADWSRSADGFETHLTDYKDVPPWLPPADQQRFEAYMQFVEAITLDRFPNDQAIAACKVDYVGLACLCAAIAKPMLAGDTVSAMIIGNNFKQTGQVPECRQGIASDPAYQGLASEWTQAAPCPTGQVLDASGKCVPSGSQPVVATDTSKSSWPSWALPAIGIGAVVLGGALLLAVVNPTPDAVEWDPEFISPEKARTFGDQRFRYLPFHRLSRSDQNRARSAYTHKGKYRDEHYYYPVDSHGQLTRARARRVLAIPYARLSDVGFMARHGYAAA